MMELVWVSSRGGGGRRRDICNQKPKSWRLQFGSRGVYSLSRHSSGRTLIPCLLNLRMDNVFVRVACSSWKRSPVRARGTHTHRGREGESAAWTKEGNLNCTLKHTRIFVFHFIHFHFTCICVCLHKWHRIGIVLLPLRTQLWTHPLANANIWVWKKTKVYVRCC